MVYQSLLHRFLEAIKKLVRIIWALWTVTCSQDAFGKRAEIFRLERGPRLLNAIKSSLTGLGRGHRPAELAMSLWTDPRVYDSPGGSLVGTGTPYCYGNGLIRVDGWVGKQDATTKNEPTKGTVP